MIDAKRLLDVSVAGVGLAATAPVMLATAVAVSLDSPGGVFFRQERVGQGGQVFRIHKFRTMRVDHDGVAVSATNDPRVTRVGAILRRTKLDELPQLLDVLTGDMSLVGPRPEVPHFANMWPEHLKESILSVRPGITDPVSIAYRNEAELLAAADDPIAHYEQVILPAKAQGYADYVATRSLLGDIRILAATVAAVLR